jgi:hypothetical protein
MESGFHTIQVFDQISVASQQAIFFLVDFVDLHALHAPRRS